MIERIAQPGGGEKGDKTKSLKEWWRRRGGNGEGEEEEEEDRSSCCWVLEQASPCQIIWYLKLFDRCSESSLPSARRRRDRATVFYLRRREEIKRRCADSLVQKHNPDQPTLHTSTSDSVHVRTHTHTHTHTHTVMRLSSHSTCARARTFHSCNHTSRCRSVCGNGLT